CTLRGCEIVHPEKELTPLQYGMLLTQPDMIHQYALHLAEERARDSTQPIVVRAHAFASLNGRKSQPLVDPKTNLAPEPRSFRPKPWIVPLAPEASSTSLRLSAR